MAKKSNLSLYLIGMALVVIGCFLPLTASKFFGGGSSAFNAITGSTGGDLKAGSILALGGAIAGIAFCFVSLKSKLPVKLISLVVSIIGGLYVWISYMNGGALFQGAVKFGLKITGSKPGIGLIVILAGWVIAVLGWLKTRD
ncbi:MAG: hypothetical protein II821_07640 [Treponema sp.]|nr:hypothetical protein [Treponema sp.]